jgi:transcriptional regulator with XRE-family HTH domain
MDSQEVREDGQFTAAVEETVRSSAPVQRRRSTRRRFAIDPPALPELAERGLTFGDTLRNARKRAGLDVAEVAKRVGVSRDYLYKIERGEAPAPGTERIDQLANAVGADRDEFHLAAGKLPREVLDSFRIDPIVTTKIVRMARQLGPLGRRFVLMQIEKTMMELEAEQGVAPAAAAHAA